MYRWVSPDSRSAIYQPARAAGIQRQSGTPANHKFSASDSANRIVTHQGAAFIIALTLAPSRPILEPLDWPSGRDLEVIKRGTKLFPSAFRSASAARLSAVT